ncbi:hypothetical protein [Gimesia maris]|uniref:hypothetical protein n=1 Tax=Gimesia maris TaxID=122 RepID=UPI00241CEE90|nr:hypothetical protein [Gimesia maris]
MQFGVVADNRNSTGKTSIQLNEANLSKAGRGPMCPPAWRKSNEKTQWMESVKTSRHAFFYHEKHETTRN